MIKGLVYIFALAPLMCQAGVPWDSNSTDAIAARKKDGITQEDMEQYNKDLSCGTKDLMDANYSKWYGGQCAMVNEIEDCAGNSPFNFKTLYFCDFHDRFGESGKFWAYLPLVLFILAVAMYNLGSTADAYLSPALEAISDKLRCSESLAGVTLLALGNGAPDVFASISAGGTDTSSINLQVAALTGSALFITTVVMWLSLRASEPDKKIKVTRIFFLRDCLFINITAIYLLVIMLVFREMNLPLACGFLVIYVIFVIVVVVQSKMYNKSVEEGEAAEDDAAVAQSTARANDFLGLVAEKKLRAASVYKLTGARSIAGGSAYSKQSILDENDETAKKLRKQSTEFKGLKRQFSLNNDPREELNSNLNVTADQEKSQSHHVRQVHKSLSMRSSVKYEGDNLIEVEPVSQKDEDDDVSEDGAKMPQIGVEALDLPDQVEDLTYTSKQSFAYRKKGSVVAKVRHAGAEMRETHIEEEADKRKSQLIQKKATGADDIEEQDLPDQLFIATRIKNIFKRTSNEGFLNTCWLIVEIPLNFLRNYSCPPADHADWDRNRMSILPLTVPAALMYLRGYLNVELLKICAYLLLPGLIMTIYIQFKTTRTRPPVIIMTIAAVIGFMMSISWIGWTSDIVIDLLEILGIMLDVPKSVLGLTLLAWGNCLGDMSADVAMTKKGFGEMAITGCMAGPIFNILVGLGASMVAVFLTKNPEGGKIPWALTDESGNLIHTSIAPFALISSLIIVQMIILANACINNYSLSINMQYFNLLLYFTIVIGLVVYVLVSEKV